MSIIEKLGITPIVVNTYEVGCDDIDDIEAVRELEQQRNELLEALIKLHRHFDNSKSWGNFDSKYYAFMQITRPLIEKITGKSWEEIKQIADKENK